MQALARKIVVLGTGGTIAGTAGSAQDCLGYTSAQLSIGELLARVPGLPDIDIFNEQVAQIDSKDMHFDIWRRLALRCTHWIAQEDVRGVVIAHGTDTLEETAYFLHSVLAAGKPVVLTGAMRPATALEPDGPRNLADAVVVASAIGARGVLTVFAGQIHDARYVTKVHSHRLDPFGSAEGRPLGSVTQGVADLIGSWPPLLDGKAILGKVERARSWPRVEIVMNYAGASGQLVRALVAQGVDGIVAAGTGNGSLAVDLQDALLEAQKSGVRVVRSSRCADGGVLPHAGDVLPDAGNLSPVKARVALWLSLLPY